MGPMLDAPLPRPVALTILTGPIVLVPEQRCLQNRRAPNPENSIWEVEEEESTVASFYAPPAACLRALRPRPRDRFCFGGPPGGLIVGI